MPSIRNALGFRNSHLAWFKALFACAGWFLVLGTFATLMQMSGLAESGLGANAKRVLPVVFLAGCFFIWRSVKGKAAPGMPVFEAGLKEAARGEHEAIAAFRKNEEWELQQLEKRVAELNDSIATLDAGAQRLEVFAPVYAGKLQCPRCWVRRGVWQDLATRGSEGFDQARCPAQGCGFRFSAP